MSEMTAKSTLNPMKTTHTDGPYSISGIPGDNHVMARVQGHEGKVTVAIVPGWPGITQEEHEANMALFKSAPDLLAALQRIVATLENGDDISSGDHCIDAARAAIASATGSEVSK